MDIEAFLTVGGSDRGLTRISMDKCNKISARFGLVLTGQDMAALQKTRTESLQKSGRVEWDGGVLPQMVWTFCDSPYVSSADWTQTLQELTELFYLLKNECRDALSDEQLLAAMRRLYDAGGGSCEHLYGADSAQLLAAAQGQPDEDALWDEEGEDE